MTDPEPLSLLDQIHQHMRQHRMFVVFDLDGTLALTEHRAHHLKGARKDWRAFYAACDQDEPCHPIIQTLLALDAAGNEVEIWSGRSDEVREKTTAWMEAQGLGHIPIRTREVGDHRPDTVLKAAWLDEGRRLIWFSRIARAWSGCGDHGGSSAVRSRRGNSDAGR